MRRDSDETTELRSTKTTTTFAPNRIFYFSFRPRHRGVATATLLTNEQPASFRFGEDARRDEQRFANWGFSRLVFSAWTMTIGPAGHEREICVSQTLRDETNGLLLQEEWPAQNSLSLSLGVCYQLRSEPKSRRLSRKHLHHLHTHCHTRQKSNLLAAAHSLALTLSLTHTQLSRSHSRHSHTNALLAPKCTRVGCVCVCWSCFCAACV